MILVSDPLAVLNKTHPYIREEVQVDTLLYVLVTEVVQEFTVEDSSIVHQDVYVSHVLLYLRMHLLDVFNLSNITVIIVDRSAIGLLEFRSRGLQCSLKAVV